MIAYESEVNGGESHIALVRGDLCPDCPAFHAGPFPALASNGRVPRSLAPGDRGTDSSGSAPAESRPPCPHPVLVRVHTRCTAGDVFSADCHCREILDQSMRMIAEDGCGVILYLHNTSRGFEIERTASRRLRSRAARPSPPNSARSIPAASSCTGAARPRRPQARTGRILRAIGLGGQILSDLGIQRIRLLSNTPMHIPALEGFGLEIVEQVPIPVEECSRVG